MNYVPDRWVIVELIQTKARKILAGWRGGYADPDHWRLSSGITDIQDHDTHYTITNHSGSVYTCYKNRWGLTHLTEDVLREISDDFMLILKEESEK